MSLLRKDVTQHGGAKAHFAGGYDSWSSCDSIDGSNRRKQHDLRILRKSSQRLASMVYLCACARGASAAPYLLCIVWVRARSFNLCMRWLTCCRVAVGSSWEQNVYIVRSNDDLDFYQCPPAKNVIFDLVARPHRAQAQHTTYTASARPSRISSDLARLIRSKATSWTNG